MPTGYTHAVPEGMTFEQFVWKCARGMGALVTMRDEPMDAPIPERFEPSDYHAKSKAEAEKRLTWLRALTPQGMEAEAEKAHKEAMRHHADSEKRRDETRAAYEVMLGKVQAWTPPTADHAGLKRFMVSQLRESIDFDCTISAPEPKRMTGAEWVQAEIAEATRTYNYHVEAHAAEVRRTEERNVWLRQLRQSVPPPGTKTRKAKR